MTKIAIVQKIAEELGLTQIQAKQIVQKTFDVVVSTLVTDGRVELRNFGGKPAQLATRILVER